MVSLPPFLSQFETGMHRQTLCAQGEDTGLYFKPSAHLVVR